MYPSVSKVHAESFRAANPPNSDMGYSIFNLRTWSFLCVRMHTGVGHTDSDSTQHFRDSKKLSDFSVLLTRLELSGHWRHRIWSPRRSANGATQSPCHSRPLFPCHTPVTWPGWRERCLRYRTASKLTKEEGEVQGSSLLYALGAEQSDWLIDQLMALSPANHNDYLRTEEQSEKIVNQFDLSEEGSNDFDTVLGTLQWTFYSQEEHHPRISYRRKQKEGGNVE